jgi:hypothetical protein
MPDNDNLDKVSVNYAIANGIRKSLQQATPYARTEFLKPHRTSRNQLDDAVKFFAKLCSKSFTQFRIVLGCLDDFLTRKLMIANDHSPAASRESFMTSS